MFPETAKSSYGVRIRVRLLRVFHDRRQGAVEVGRNESLRRCSHDGFQSLSPWGRERFGKAHKPSLADTGPRTPHPGSVKSTQPAPSPVVLSQQVLAGSQRQGAVKVKDNAVGRSRRS
jgi:hypothetical protein